MIFNIHFLQPFWFAILILPLLWILFTQHKILYWPQLIQPLSIRYPLISTINLNTTDSFKPSKTSNLALAFIVFLLMLSLAQPVRYTQSLPDKATTEAVDLILVVNTSISMVLKDNLLDGLQVDRMTMARELLQQLVENFKGRRIGLVVLGRPASIWLPLTGDRELVKHAISRLQITLGGRNSDIGETLELVRTGFDTSHNNDNSTEDPAINLTINQTEKIVLLAADGYQQIGTIAPEIAVQKLVKSGFLLHTLAIGSSVKPSFELGKGSLIYSPVDLQLMQKLALSGQGEMVHGRDETSIEKLLGLLSRPASTTNSNKNRKLMVTLYHYPLTLALIILIAQLLPIAEFRIFASRRQF